MKRKNATRSTLLMSIISMLLCVSMLVGTTFAWFTDEVTSVNNVIKSGNLDVALYYQVEGQSDWSKVDANTNIFKQDTLWEPGHTEVVKLKVVNEGTLTLKYQLGVNVAGETTSKSVLGNELKLSDYIKYGVVAGEQTYTREQAVAAVDANATALNAAYSSGTVALAPEAEQIVTVVVYMPTSVGNAANYAKDEAVPTIHLGINLYATQKDAENDSFGPDYDEDAWHADMVVYNAADLQGALANGGNIALGADIVLTEEWTPIGTSEAPFTGAIDGNGHTITGLTADGDDTVAMIAYAGDNVVIKNITLEDVNINSAQYAAGLVGTAGTGLVIENVKVSGTVNATSYAAGIVFEADNATIKNCENNAAVTSKRASGIGSWITNITVENVVNNGDITGSTGAAGIAEGFSGTMKNATNNGTIKSTGIEPASGIAGVQKGASTYEYCVNNGDVTSTADNPNASAAGILGHTPGSAATFNYCINTGKITAEASYAAGIGYSLYGNVKANYCYNSGDVAGADGAGGIAPKAQYGTNDTANHCVVDAAVTSANGTVYNLSNKNTNSYYYAEDVLYRNDGTAVTAKDAKTALDAHTGGIFFKVVNGRLEASLAYDWQGDVRVSNDTELQAALDATVGDWVIVLLPGEYGTIVAKSNITLVGTPGAVVGCVNLNGSSNVTLKGITFDAAGAKTGYDGKGNAKQTANIITGDASKPNAGAKNLVIDGCTFTGAFVDGGVAICLTDQSRGSGQSENITITNCTFEATNRYYDIYAHYSGKGYLTIEGNTFASEESADIPANVKVYNIYLGRYQSAVPVVVKDNTFENVASFTDAAYLQDHSDVGVSFGDTTGNTFGG